MEYLEFCREESFNINTIRNSKEIVKSFKLLVDKMLKTAPTLRLVN